jgi:hypothetical protein
MNVLLRHHSFFKVVSDAAAKKMKTTHSGGFRI